MRSAVAAWCCTRSRDAHRWLRLCEHEHSICAHAWGARDRPGWRAVVWFVDLAFWPVERDHARRAWDWWHRNPP